MHERFRDALLRFVGRVVSRHRLPILLVALGLAVAGVVYAAGNLGFQTDRSLLVSAELDWNRGYLEYKRRFPRWGDVLVIVERDATAAGESGVGEDPQAASRKPQAASGESRSGEDDRAAEFVHALSERLRHDPHVRAISAGYDAEPQHARLMLSLSEEAFAWRWEEMRQSLSVIESASLADLLRQSLLGLAGGESGVGEDPQAASGESGLAGLTSLLERIDASTRDSRRPILPQVGGWRPLESESGRLLLMSVAVAPDIEGVASVAQGVALIREHMDELRREERFRGIDAGVTGIPAIESDETVQSIADSTMASGVALILISALLIAIYRGIVVPLAAVAALGVGIAWSFGYATLVVGHLQVLSVVVTVILLGLGIGFAIYLTARLELTAGSVGRGSGVRGRGSGVELVRGRVGEGKKALRNPVKSATGRLHCSTASCLSPTPDPPPPDLGEVLARVYRAIGPGLITGAVTTAAAFSTTLLTDFRGVAEMGLIAAGGILLCLVAMLTVYPALLGMLPDWRRHVRHRPGGEHAHFAHGMLDFVDRRPWAMVAVGAVVVVAMIPAALQTRYDPNILNLQAPGVESVVWETRLLEDGDRTAWVGLSVVESLEEAQRLTLTYLEQDQHISAVEGVGVLFHPQREQRRREVAAAMPEIIPESRTASAAEALTLLRQLRAGLAAGSQRPGLEAEMREELQSALAATDRLIEMLDSPDGESRWQRAEHSFARGRAFLVAMWRAVADPAGPSLDDLPPPVRDLNTGRGGLLLLRINPAGAESVLEPDRLGAFVGTMRRIDPDVLGPAIQIYESTQLIARAYGKATILAVLIIALILILDFRSAPDAALSLLPVTIGFVGLFGIMGLTGLPLNFANIIVMPVIFGIGVDAGVHMVHRWRLDPDGIPRGLSGGTGRGILITTITAMIGFGSLALAEHRGIRGLGITMVIGLALTLLACFTILPAILRLRTLTEAPPSDRAH